MHVFVLLIFSRYSVRLYVSYSTFYVLGLILSMQIPFVGFHPVRTSEHMFALAVFGLLQIYAFVDYLQTKIFRWENDVRWIVFFFVLLVGCALGSVASSTGYVAPWSGRFYSLWNWKYAETHLPIISSVSEHQPTVWSTFFLGRISRHIGSRRTRKLIGFAL